MGDLIIRNGETGLGGARERGSSVSFPASEPLGKTKIAGSREVTTEMNTVGERRVNRELKPPVGLIGGVLFGLASAILYTMANIALRHCVGLDSFLVSAVKAAPTVLLLGPYLIWMAVGGEVLLTSSRMIPRFLAAALVGQFVGNSAFQFALGMIGLAIAVPITLGTMIIGSAILGRMMLHEPVRLRTWVAMLVLIASVFVLSLPQNAVPIEEAVGVVQEGESASRVVVGSFCAAASGLAYSLFGVVLRQAMVGGLSAPLAMFISGLVGTISLWSVTLVTLGMDSIAAVTFDDWGLMLIAGMLNLMAFVALTTSLKSLPVVAVNLINASQVAMAAVGGILVFAEPITAPLIIGISLTLLGLGILAGRRRTPEPATT